MAAKMRRSRFFCTRCGKENTMGVWRKPGQAREAGHLKNLFCIYCNEVVNHIELTENNPKYTMEDVNLELGYDNFTGDGQRVQTLNELKLAIRKGEFDYDE